MLNKNLKQKRLGIAVFGLAAAAMFAAAVPVTSVFASGDETAMTAADLPLIEISMEDTNPMSTLKREVIAAKAKNDTSVSMTDIDVMNSQIEADGFDRTSLALQNVLVKVSLSDDQSSKSVGYDFAQNVTVKMVKSNAPQLKLKSDSVTVNNGDVWNASSYIAYVNDDTGVLPALLIDGEPNMSEDGTYPVSYTAVDAQGNKTTANLTVTVRTPEEVLEARRLAEEEAARIAAEEEAARLAAEEAERQRIYEEEQAALAAQQAQQAASYEGTGSPVYGGGDNPYYGGNSNCVWTAWQAAHDYSGVSLPNLGWAGSWLYNAQANGYATGYGAAPGSVAVYSGHVAYVTQVSADGSAVYIVEGGFNGGYNERWISASYPDLQGYIYLGG